MPLMLLTICLRFGVFEFGQNKKYPKNYIYSSQFWRIFGLLAVKVIAKSVKSTGYIKVQFWTFGAQI